MSSRPRIRVRRRKRGNGVVADGRKRRGVEPHVTGWRRRANEGRGRGMGVGGTCSATGVVFGHNFVDCSREVDEQVFLQVARRTS